MMSRTVQMTAGCLVMALAGLLPGAERPTGFNGKQFIPTNFGVSGVSSPDQQAHSILCDNLIVSLEPALSSLGGIQNQTAVQSKVFTVHIPYHTDQRSVDLQLDIRGFIHTQSGARARLVACCGNATKVVDLTPDQEGTVQLKGSLKKTLMAANPRVKYGDFYDRVLFKVQTHAAKPVLPITLFLLVEHDTDKEGAALLAIDSLDFSFAAPRASTH